MINSFKYFFLASIIANMPIVSNAQWYIGADFGINIGSDIEYEGTQNLRQDRTFGSASTGLFQVGYDFFERGGS